MHMPKVTVYIPTHNYGRFLDKAIGSVLSQTMSDWELLVIDDGSTDDTQQILEKYKNHPEITIITQENQGLNVTNNVAIRLSRGRYIMRLDADDYLDENCLMVLSSVLDQKKEVGLVYPDYYQVDEEGETVELIRRKKIGEEVELLDLPAHGACTMIRKEVLLSIGSYNEEFSCQDGYDLWIRLIQNYNPYNVNLPLFYYRRHSVSLTKKEKKILDTRQEIKRSFLDKNDHIKVPKTLGIIPVLSSSVYPQNRPFVSLAGKPLIWYSITEALQSNRLDRIIVAAGDDETLSYVHQTFPKVGTFRRTGKLLESGSSLRDLSLEILRELKGNESYEPDAVCLLYISTPLRRAKHINQAIDTMAIFDVDSVLSIQEELAPCYHHEKFGLTSINVTESQTRLERKSIFKENGAIFLSRKESLENSQRQGHKVGHITMLPEESVKINTDFEFWLAEKILTERLQG